MAIFGVGSKWDEEDLKNEFFSQGKFVLGWNERDANDLYAFVASLKVGDILYIKANAPGSRSIRVKGVGVVTKNLVGCIRDEELGASAISDWKSLFVHVAWIHKEEFGVLIPPSEGKLTNVRAATMYEKYLPYVQEAILARIIGRKYP